jgi:opacity protein-like surface antigen
MKKVLAVCAFTLFSASIFAQLSGGIRLGMNLANQKQEFNGESLNGSSKIGVLGGLYLVANVTEKFAIQPEFVFSALGSTDPDFDDIKYNFNYISVPVMLRYNLTENFNLQAGPQLGLLMSAKASDGDTSTDLKDDMKGIDFGAAFGAGVDFGKFNAGARYYLGFSDIADVAAEPDLSIKNSGFQIFLGYRLFGGE